MALDLVPVQNVPVTFAVDSGGGSITGNSVVNTDASGVASAPVVLGSTAGPNTFTATMASGATPTVTFHETGSNTIGSPATIQILSGNGQTGPTSTQLANPLMVKIKDSNGAAVPNANVTFSVPGGSTASIATAQPVQTDSTGMALAYVNVGTTGGTYTFNVASGAATASFTEAATVVAGPPSSIQIVSGDLQIGTIGTHLANALSVLVLDTNNNPVPNAAVNFMASGSGAVVTSQPMMTNSLGSASAIVQLGSSAGAYTYIASITVNGNPVTVTFHESASVAAGDPDVLSIFGGNNKRLR